MQLGFVLTICPQHHPAGSYSSSKQIYFSECSYAWPTLLPWLCLGVCSPFCLSCQQLLISHGTLPSTTLLCVTGKCKKCYFSERSYAQPPSEYTTNQLNAPIENEKMHRIRILNYSEYIGKQQVHTQDLLAYTTVHFGTTRRNCGNIHHIQNVYSIKPEYASYQLKMLIKMRNAKNLYSELLRIYWQTAGARTRLFGIHNCAFWHNQEHLWQIYAW